MIGNRWSALGCAVAGTMLVLWLGACSEGSAPSDDAIPSAEAADIGDAVADEGEQASLAVEPIARGCATVDDLTDADHDGAPDHATFTYALPACDFTGHRGGTLDVTGTIVLSDPTPTRRISATRRPWRTLPGSSPARPAGAASPPSGTHLEPSRTEPHLHREHGGASGVGRLLQRPSARSPRARFVSPSRAAAMCGWFGVAAVRIRNGASWAEPYAARTASTASSAGLRPRLV
jgi:hypothetical protein